MTKHTHDQNCCSEYTGLSRRNFLGRAGLTAAAGVTSPAWLPSVALGRGSAGGPRDVMVHTFLRGAIDGLSLVVPHGDPWLYNHRPTLAVPPPPNANGAIDLDGFFGLNPNAQGLTVPWNNNHLAIVHAGGSTDPTRSHFDGMKAMEGGVPNQPLTFIESGWLGRHLADTAPTGNGLLRGMALEDIMPLHLVGEDATLPVRDPANFDFPGRPVTLADRRQVVETMYQTAPDPLDGAALSTFATIDLLATIDFDNYTSDGATPYPGSLYGQKLRATAALIKADINLEAVGIDYGGWDHHVGLGPLNGIFANMVADLSTSVEAFYLDLLATGHIDSTVMLFLSEFGRRVAENVSAGTDHGHGNVILALGGHINGGQMFANWPGLNPGALVDGDLAITLDYRDVVSEILEVRMSNTNLGNIFPNHTPVFPGITV